jgi:RHS repeat-associated protein
MKSGIEAPPKRYRYTGMERDEESGLSYHGQRSYATEVARWISSDPTGIADGLNVFCYVRGNPQGLVDRAGGAADAFQAAKEGKLWETFIMNKISGQIPLVEQVTIKGMVDDKEVTSVADGLGRTDKGLTVFESKLNPTTMLTDPQKKLMEKIKKGGAFQIAATEEKKLKALGKVLGLSPKGSLIAHDYVVVNRGNANLVLQAVKAIGPDEVAVMVKGGKFVTYKKEEALLVEKFIQSKPWMQWEDAVKAVRESASAAKEVSLAEKAGKAEAKAMQQGASEAFSGLSPGPGDRINEYDSLQQESVQNGAAVGALGNPVTGIWTAASGQLAGADAGVRRARRSAPAAVPQEEGFWSWLPNPFASDPPDAGTLKDAMRKADDDARRQATQGW